MRRILKVAIAALIILVVVGLALTGRKEHSPTVLTPTSHPPPTSTRSETTSTPLTSKTTITASPTFKEPFFTLNTRPVAILVPRGGSFNVSLKVLGFNGFSDRVTLEIKGVWYHGYGVESGIYTLKPELVKVTLDRVEVEPSEAVRVRVRLEDEAPAGAYTLVLVGRSEGRTYTLPVPFRVYEYPSYLIRPLPVKPVIKAGEWVEIPVSVEPIGAFNGTVKLKATASRGVTVKLENATGRPPFTAKLKLLILDRWRGVLEANQTTNFENLYVIISGTPPGPTAVIMLGMDKPEEKSLLGTLMGIVTLPLRITIGITLGLTMELAYRPVLPTVPGGAMLASGLKMFLPELAEEAQRLQVGGQGTFINKNNHWSVYVRLAVISSSKPAAIVAPTANIPASPGHNLTIPITIFYSDPAELKLKAWWVKETLVLFPPQKKVKIQPIKPTLEVKEDRLEGAVKFPGDAKRVMLEVWGAHGLLDKVKIALVQSTTIHKIIVAVRPGEEAILMIPGRPVTTRGTPGGWLSTANVTHYPQSKPRPALEEAASAAIYDPYNPPEQLPASQIFTLETAAYNTTHSLVILKVNEEASPGTYIVMTKGIRSGETIENALLYLVVIRD